MDQTAYYRKLGFTREADMLDLCPQCKAEHWYHPTDRIEQCDVCGFHFPDSSDEEE